MPRAAAAADDDDQPACADFFTGPIHAAQPAGHLETLFDVQTYVTRGTATSNSTIIFLTDDFGLNLVNNKLLADQYASRTGLRVLVPNLLPNGGLSLSTIGLSERLAASVQWYNVFGHARRAWTALKIIVILAAFSFRVRRTFPCVLSYARAVRASLPLGSKLGIAGFCLGGHWSSRLCAEHATERGGSHLVGAHFTAHPSGVDPDELARVAERFRVPQSLALGDRDDGLPIAQAHELETNLRAVYRDSPDRLEVRIYDGCGRGFALRADPQANENQGADLALEQAVAWFRRWLV
ncbi:putative dienelactone hydrolase family protein [Diaporthe ampelina]|uniref:Putative dienelactone hydrolase family protein n=1 Tax=Diaporthe ampelina TaxID=1214573 RepID=A0A0G2HVY5_9PEZI|nr:putative dienelactone hydrolase family protein [Diaporthe ampelina]